MEAPAYYFSYLYRNTRSFENWATFSDIPQLKLGNVWSRGVFRSIACERKYLIDYKCVILLSRTGRRIILILFRIVCLSSDCLKLLCMARRIYENKKIMYVSSRINRVTTILMTTSIQITPMMCLEF